MPAASSRSVTLLASGLFLAALTLQGCGGRSVPVAAPPVQPPPTSQAAPAPIDVPGRPVAPPGVEMVPEAMRARVALLVPLSGTNGALGRALLEAAQLALFDMANPAFSLLPRDSEGTPEGAARAATAALADGAQLIIGPLLGAEAQAVAPIAQARGVPVVSLSNDRDVARPGVFVFGLSPQLQIDRAIDYMRSRGMTRFGGLVPANRYGQVTEEALRRAVTRVGGSLVAVERYGEVGEAAQAVRRLASLEARQASLAQQRRQLTGRTDPASQQALRRLDAIEEGSGGASFDAILVADFGDRLLAVAPLLPYHDIDPARIRVFGTALWEDPRLGREPALAGAWFAAPSPKARETFLQRYREVYGRAPPRLATLAYDAVALAAVLARGRTPPDFSVTALTNPNGFDGVDGIFRLLPDGTAERGLAVLEIRRDELFEVSPAPTTFQRATQ